MAFIHIGMPVYNAEEYIEATLKCILNQSFEDFVIVVSDNASTDRTVEIIERLSQADSRIVLFKQNDNIGPVANFDFVLSQAKAEYVLFAAHDDKWSPDFLRDMHVAAVEHPSADLIVPTVVLTSTQIDPKTKPVDLEIFSKKGLLRIISLLQHANGCWFYGLYRREAAHAAIANIRQYDYVWGCDLIAITPFILSGRLAACPSATFYHHETGNTISLYKPITLNEKVNIYIAFLRSVLRSLNCKVKSKYYKAVLFPFIIVFTGKHSCRLRRILRTLFFPKRKERQKIVRKITIS